MANLPINSKQSIAFKFFLTLTSLICILTISACSTPPAPKAGEIKATPTITTKPQQEVMAIDSALYQQALKALEDGETQKAEYILKKLSAKTPQHFGPWANLAIINFQNKKIEAAEKYALTALEQNTLNPQTLNLSGLIATELGKFREAESYYKRAIENDLQYAKAHFNLALLYDVYFQDIANAVLHYKRYLLLTNFEDKTTVNWVEQLENSLANGANT
jgi:Tfp pilus assembly protein PilF